MSILISAIATIKIHTRCSVIMLSAFYVICKITYQTVRRAQKLYGYVFDKPVHANLKISFCFEENLKSLVSKC